MVEWGTNLTLEEPMRYVLPIVAGVALAAPASADIVHFSFPIEVAQANPAPTIPAGVPIPSGMGMVTLVTDTNEISWVIEYENLTGDIVSPGAHFHGPAGPGSNAGIQIFLSTGNPSEPPSGTLAGGAVLDDQQEADLLAGLWYVNIHTALNGSGEIRGQVVPNAGIGALFAVAGLGASRRRR